jgi:hypothetical protein
MRGDVRVGSRVRPTAAKDVLHGLWAAALALLMASSVVSAQENSNQAGSSSTTKLPEIHVIATTPVASPRVTPRAPAAAPAPTRAPATTAAATEAAPKAVPGAVELDKIPSNIQTVGASAFDGTKAPDLLQSMDRALPGVSLSSQTGNEFQLDLNYRGYVAGPVIGTPEGLAVYQNGVRINEVFGDVVNWDLIPQKAINQLTLVPSNPVYGLNATGGAVAVEMKNGYTYHAVEGEVSGGSYGRAGASVQAGGEVGNLSGYIVPMPSTMPAGARIRRHRYGASSLISAHAATRPNFTSASRGQTIASARTQQPPCKCSRKIGRAPTHCRKRRKINLPS